MTTRRIFKVFARSTFLLAAVLAAALAGGCMQTMEPVADTVQEQSAVSDIDAVSEAPEQDATDADELALPEEPMCCSWGYYICPTSGEAWDYEALSCGWPSKSTASRACNLACSAVCIDSGWYDC